MTKIRHENKPWTTTNGLKTHTLTHERKTYYLGFLNLVGDVLNTV